MIKLLILGSKGQVGKTFQKYKYLFDNYSLTFLSRSDFDFANTIKLNNFFKNNKFDVIVNLSAYTNVDKAELNFKDALLINKDLPYFLSKIALKENSYLIHLSTDYVFDGEKKTPYLETDIKNPINNYGLSKSLGEDNIISLNPKSIIIRTSWVYSKFGINFVKKIIDKSLTEKKIFVVDDQLSSPTYALDIIILIKSILDSSLLKDLKNTEIYNFSNRGECSNYTFAKEIMNINDSDTEIIPINSEKFNSIVNRPKYSFLDTKKIENSLDIKIHDWRYSLKKFFDEKFI